MTDTTARFDWSVIWRDRWIGIVMIVSLTVAVAVLRTLDLIADTPVWAYVLALVFAQAVAVASAVVFPPGGDTRSVWLRTLVHVAAASVPIYMTGLGPILAIGFVTIAADQIRRDGARSARPVYVWSVLAMAVGELLVATDVVPSLLSESRSHALAVLMAGVMAASILLFARVAGERERNEQTSLRLLDLAHVLSEAGTRGDVSQRVADAVPHVVGLDRALVVLREGDRFSVSGTHGYPNDLDEALRSLEISASMSPLLERLLDEPEIIHISSATEDEFVQQGFMRFGAVESYVAPIVTTGTVVGFIVADRTVGGPKGLSPIVEQRMRGLADQTAIALENGRLIEQERGVIDQLREADRLKSEFLAVVSHELRTPLSVMMGAARTMQWRGADLADDTRGDLVESIVRRGEQLNRLVEDLLQASGDIQLELSPVDVSAVVRTAVADSATLHPDATVACSVPEESVVVRADAFRVRQVVDNLVENAHKYGGSDGAIDVVVTWSPTGDEAHVCVADTGAGMTAEQAAHAFDAFYQGDSSAVRKVGGLGLGLHICRRIVEAHGGRIWLDSSPGEGTRVTLALPVNGPAR
jgi:K+-sensing histidine kinase KdpD